MRFLSLFIIVALASSGRAQEDLNVLKSESNGVAPRKMLYTYLQAEAQKQFDARRAAIAAIKTPQDVERRQLELRAKFINAIGGFPARTDLNARVIGAQQRDGYRVERVIYESRPQHHITASLYIPDGLPPFPGVLMPIGHSANGKAAEYVQRGSILLAKNGIAVLAYDPIGQGERSQLLNAQGKPAIAGSTSEHTMVGVGALLVGRNTASYRIWDGIRSLDYLASRPEIDAKRLGCTGCSGGGTLTSYLMSLDERMVAAAPSCYITSLERLFATIGPQDAEQNITGQVAFGMEHADYLNMRAVRPTLICAATRDFFDIQGTWTTFREAKRIYGLMGHAERVELAEYDTTHGYPKQQREAVVRWMRRWLLGKDDAPQEADFAIAKDQDLACTRTGQVLEDLKGKSVFDLNAEKEQEFAVERAKLGKEQSKDGLLKQVRTLISLPDRLAVAKRTDVGRLQRQGIVIEKCIFETEPGIRVPALDFRPEQNPARPAPLIIYVHGDGKHGDAGPGGPIERLAKNGQRVVAIDLRGMGETAPGSDTGNRTNQFGVDSKEAFLALHLNRPLLGQRVADLLAVVRQLREQQAQDIHVIGIGMAGPIVLHAAALDPTIQQLTVDRAVLSWAAVVHSRITRNQLSGVVPGALAAYDLPDLAGLIAPRKLTIRSAVDPMQQAVSQEALEQAYASGRAAYAKTNEEKQLTLQQGESR